MSVFTVLWLDCNGPGCAARFVPSDPVQLAPALRDLAEDAGWVVGRKGDDHCPACAKGLRMHKLARGTCSHCGTPRALTRNATVVLHTRPQRDRYGRLIPCDGGDLPPERILSWGASGPLPGWKQSA
jgi:hypothetical protein